MKLAEYHKLARKLKLIPVSAENACGHDFEIRTSTEYGPSTMVQCRTQIQVWRFSSHRTIALLQQVCVVSGPNSVAYSLQQLLRKLITDVDEECSRLTDMKLSLEESIEQVPRHFTVFLRSPTVLSHFLGVFFLNMGLFSL